MKDVGVLSGHFARGDAYLLDVLFQDLCDGEGNAGQFPGEVGQGYYFMANIVLEVFHGSPPVIDHHLLLVFGRHDEQLISQAFSRLVLQISTARLVAQTESSACGCKSNCGSQGRQRNLLRLIARAATSNRK